LLSGKKTASTLAKKLREPDDKSNFRSIFKQKRPTIEKKRPTIEKKRPTIEKKRPTIEKKRPTGPQTSRPLLAEMENGRHFLENGKFFLFFFKKNPFSAMENGRKFLLLTKAENLQKKKPLCTD